jgi:hypothetical protein
MQCDVYSLIGFASIFLYRQQMNIAGNEECKITKDTYIKFVCFHTAHLYAHVSGFKLAQEKYATTSHLRK